MRRNRNQLTLAAVAFVLGLLVVVQLRAQASGSGLAALSSQELTVLVGNLNAHNESLRGEVASLERDLTTLSGNRDRGASSVDQALAELARIRAYAGLEPVGGPGVTVTVDGPIDGPGVEDLINELRNAGAEAIGVDGIRLAAGSVVTGTSGDLSVDGVELADSFEVGAIGPPETLTGSLTRSGGLVAQLAATYPDVVLTVTPVERMALPATTRNLLPIHGGPRV
jgi:uncharacterized protein YlxW (UPF0749 family)